MTSKKASFYKPQGMHDVAANLLFKDAAAGLEFYKTAFGGVETMRMPSPDGKKIWHAEMRIGDSTFFLNDEFPGGYTVAPSAEHKPTSSVQLYVTDCDQTFNQAIAAGGKPLLALTDMFWGDRMGMLQDPFGHVWTIATHKLDLTAEEIRKGGDEFAARMAGKQPA